VAGDSEEQQALALLQKEMLAFILEGITERIERGDAPVLADTVAAAIGKQVEAAIATGLRRFDLPTATRIAEEAARIARTTAEDTAASPSRIPSDRPVFEPRWPGEDPDVGDDEESRHARGPGWRRLVSPLWLVVLLLLLLGVAGWFVWQKSNALDEESAAKTRIAVQRDSLSGEICKSANAQQQRLALLRNTDVYKKNCPEAPQAVGPPEFCQAIDALDRASRPGSDCTRN